MTKAQGICLCSAIDVQRFERLLDHGVLVMAVTEAYCPVVGVYWEGVVESVGKNACCFFYRSTEAIAPHLLRPCSPSTSRSTTLYFPCGDSGNST